MPKQKVKLQGDAKGIASLSALFKGDNPEIEIQKARDAWRNVEWANVNSSLYESESLATIMVPWKYLHVIIREQYVDADTRHTEGDLEQDSERLWTLYIHVPSCHHEHDCCGCCHSAEIRFITVSDRVLAIATTRYNY